MKMELLLLYMLIATGAIGQKSATPVIGANGDTLYYTVPFTKVELDRLTIKIISLAECNEAADSTESALKTSLVLNETKTGVIKDQNTIIQKMDSIIKHDSKLFLGYKESIKTYQEIGKKSEDYERRLRTKLSATKVGAWFGWGIALVLAGKIIFFR